MRVSGGMRGEREGRREVGQIRHLDLKLSYACNNNCIHCVVADQRARALERRGRDYRTTGEVLRELWEARGRYDLVTFTGGEPTLRKDLAVLVRACVAFGFQVGIQTNGRVLAYDGARTPLLGLGVRFVVAIHGPDARTHEAITRAQGSFEQTVRAIEALSRAGEKVTGKVVITRANLERLWEISRLLVGLGVRRANFTFPHGLGNAAIGYEEKVPKFEEVVGPLRAAVEAMERGGGEAVTEGIPLCVLGDRWRMASENYYRAFVHSEVRQLDQGPRDWSRDRVAEGKVKVEACLRCPMEAMCEGVWKEYVEARGDGEIGWRGG